jgi:type VI secretion system protein ImpF
MSSRELEPTVKQSVLDRLIDNAPHIRQDPPASWSESVQQLRIAVRRDLEWLLNTRRIIWPASAEYPELRASLYHYGLPDVTSLSGDSEETPRILARQMEECIELYEPRLTAIRVTTGESDSSTRHRIRFIIEALLRMDPDPERVMFDTTLEVTSGDFEVKSATDA